MRASRGAVRMPLPDPVEEEDAGGREAAVEAASRPTLVAAERT